MACVHISLKGGAAEAPTRIFSGETPLEGIYICAAGILSDAQLSVETNDDGPESDAEKIRQAIKSLGLDAKGIKSLWNFILAFQERLQQCKAYMGTISRLAEALLDVDALINYELKLIVRDEFLEIVGDVADDPEVKETFLNLKGLCLGDPIDPVLPPFGFLGGLRQDEIEDGKSLAGGVVGRG